MKKLGFFFGAGAELAYSLPTGSNFAIEIFKQDFNEQKSKIESMIKKIQYSKDPSLKNWFPDESHTTLKIRTFQKPEQTKIIQSSIEYNKTKVNYYFEQFDEYFYNIIKHNKIYNEFYLKFMSLLQLNYSNYVTIQNEVIKCTFKLQINPALDNIFQKSNILAVILMLLDNQDGYVKSIGKYIEVFSQIQLLVEGEKTASKLNSLHNIENIQCFQSIGNTLKLNYNSLSSNLYNLLFSKKYKPTSPFSRILQEMLNKLFANIINYYPLIDNYYRYLFEPKTGWNNFCKITTFLYSVKEYIDSKIPQNLEKIDSYYTDIRKSLLDNKVQIQSIGTSNYTLLINKIIPEISNDDIHFLNGSTHYYYDPFRNDYKKISSEAELENDLDSIYVPFIFTQSGLKPLTSIKMSQQYTKLFEQYKNSDAVICIGYSFNPEDSHINSIFRTLIVDQNKDIYVVKPLRKSEQEAIEDVRQNLRININLSSKIKIINIDNNSRNLKDNVSLNWLEYICNQI